MQWKQTGAFVSLVWFVSSGNADMQHTHEEEGGSQMATNEAYMTSIYLKRNDAIVYLNSTS